MGDCSMAGSSSSLTLSLQSYRVKSSNLTIKVGDDVLVRPSSGTTTWVAKVDKILSNKTKRNVTIVGRWYYWPENLRGGRKDFHGTSELLYLSNHYDNLIRPESIDGKCKVHTLKEYRKLEIIGPDDYYCRLEYDVVNNIFKPSKLPVFCSCEKPYNPDLRMILCEGCGEWYHIRCIGMTDAEVDVIGNYICSTCEGAAEASGQKETAISIVVESREAHGKIPAKRRRVTAAGSHA